MIRILSKLYDSSPKEPFQYVEKRIGLHGKFSERMTSAKPHAVNGSKTEEISEALQRKFEVYTTSNLKGITPKKFWKSIQSRIGTVDAQTEGYSAEEVEQQRDLSIKFHWVSPPIKEPAKIIVYNPARAIKGRTYASCVVLENTQIPFELLRKKLVEASTIK